MKDGKWLKHLNSGRQGWFNAGTLRVLKGIPAGWIEIPAPEKEPVPTYKKPEKVPEKKLEVTREHMIDYLKSTGERVNWNIGNDKLKERYEDKIKKDGNDTGSVAPDLAADEA
jgi:hypothetical protein